jgi:hypothetical protein
VIAVFEDSLLDRDTVDERPVSAVQIRDRHVIAIDAEHAVLAGERKVRRL